jgi:hypothetical protein
MSEDISAARHTAGEGVYSGVWVDPENELPGESETVLVLLEDYSVGFGYVIDGGWEIALPPWEPRGDGGGDVLYWTKLPLP